jgi:N12 class adenine-specific DNA methylase
MPSIADLRRDDPDLQGLTDDQVVDVYHQAYYPDLDREQVSSALGFKAPPPPAEPRTLGGTIKDAAISVGKGFIGVPEAAVGLLDLPTGGAVGKALENEDGMIGFRPKQAKAMLDEGLSDAQKGANKQVMEADGLWETVKAAIRNPSVAAHSVLESLPMIGAGGLVGRGVVAMSGGRVGGAVGGGLGEGVASAGSAAEHIRQQTPDGLLTPEQGQLAGATGATTTLFGVLGNKIAQRLGLADIDTVLTGAATNPKAAKSVTRMVLEGMAAEGLLEELPQSVSEQVLQNMALGKPIDEGVNQAAVLGTMAGGLMGGGANLYRGVKDGRQLWGAAPATPAAPPVPPPAPAAPPTPGEVLAAPSVDAAIDKALEAVGVTLTGTSPAELLGPPGGQEELRQAMQEPRTLTGQTAGGMIGAAPQDPILDPAQEGAAVREDQKQADLANAAVDRMTRDASREAQDIRGFDPLTLPRKQPTLPELDAVVQPGDVLAPSGGLFTAKAAALKAKATRGTPIEVNGGWIVRPAPKGEKSATQPDQPGGTGLAVPAAAAERPGVPQFVDADGGGRPAGLLQSGVPAASDGLAANGPAARAAGAAPAGVQRGDGARNTPLDDDGAVQGGRGRRADGDDAQAVAGQPRPVVGADGAGGLSASGRESEQRPAVSGLGQGERGAGEGGAGRAAGVTPPDDDPGRVLWALAPGRYGNGFLTAERIGSTLGEKGRPGYSIGTERAQAILDDLKAAGKVARDRHGRYYLTESEASTDVSREGLAQPEGSKSAPTDAADPVDAEVQAIIAVRKKANASGQNGEDAQQIRDAIAARAAAPADADSGLAARWDGMSLADRATLLSRTAAKAKGIQRTAAKTWAELEPGWRRTAERLLKERAPATESTAPEHSAVGVDERELGEIVEEFNDAQRRMADADEPVTHVFDAPAKDEVVRLQDKARVFHKDHGWMTVEQAKARIAEWKKRVAAQADYSGDGQMKPNSERVVLSLFDLTGKWSQPWEEAGYQVYRYDIQDDATYEDSEGNEKKVGDINNFSVEFFSDMYGAFESNDVHAVLAACPCTDFAVSGARHFAAKDADGRTVASVKLVHMTLATVEYFKPAVWAVENPVGRIEKLGGLPPWRLSFDPNHLGDPYTKKTLLWGRFNADLPIAPVEPTEGSKMHSQYGGKSLKTKNARSATPEGFSYGFFLANNAIDHPLQAIANKYDRLDRDVIKQALDAGLTEDQIESVLDDPYYIDLDDAAAEQALLQAIKDKPEAPIQRGPAAGDQPRDPESGQFVAEEEVTSSRQPLSDAEVAELEKMLGHSGAVSYKDMGGHWRAEGTGNRLALPVRTHGSTRDSARRNLLVKLRETHPLPTATPQVPNEPGTNVLPSFVSGRGKKAAGPSKAAARKLRQAWPTDAIDGYTEMPGVKAEQTDFGLKGGVKDEFLKDGRAYLRAVADELLAYGFRPPIDAKNRVQPPVRINEGGPAVAGDVYLDMRGPGDADDSLRIQVGANWREPNRAQIMVQRVRSGSPVGGNDFPSSGATAGELAQIVAKRWGIAEKREPEAPEPAPSANTVFTDDMAEKARAVLRAKLKIKGGPGGKQAGQAPILDPEVMLAGMTLAGYHIEKGARKFAAYAKAMLEDLGGDVRPYLKGWYLNIKHDPRASGFSGEMSSSSFVEEFDLDAIAAPSDSAAIETGAPSADTGEQDGTATRNLDRAGEAAPEGAPPAGVRAPDGSGQAGAAPADGGRGGQPGDADATGQRPAVDGGVGAGPRTAVPAGRKGRGDAGAGRVPGAPRPDAGPGLFGDAGREGSAGVAPNAQPPAAPQFVPEDFTIEDDFALGEGGQKAKFRKNIEAIRLVKDLNAADASLGGGRVATAEEQKVLARYVGWGGLAQAFDEKNADWSREYAELKELLTDEEYDAAKRSTRYAHYTSREVIQDGIYAALRRFGFTGGKVLEGGAGVGNFIGLMPRDMRSAGRVTAVEREFIAGGIAKALYPLQNVQLQDFTEFKGNDGYFDAAVGNPPFASDPQVDRSGRKHLSGLSLHNYFFAKEVDMLREGGILAQVVTNSFLDSSGDRARRYIAERTKFLGAIRLPNNAFSKNAGTEVTTDLIFLQKRPESEWGSKLAKDEAKVWMDSREYKGADGKPVALNAYFHANPEMMLGEFGAYGTMYRGDMPALIARKGQDTAALLREAVQRLPENIYRSPAETGTEQAIEQAVIALKAPPAQEGGYFEQDGKLIQRIRDMAGEARGVEITPATQWTEKTKLGDDGFDKIKRLSALRRTLRDLLAAEMSGDEKMEALRKTLNEQYDAFVKEHHLINERGTFRVFDDDPDLPLLLSLEMDYRPGMSLAEAKRNGVKRVKASAKKAAIFSRRVIQAREQIRKADSPKDAVSISMAERGRLDAAYVAELLGREDSNEVLRELASGDDPLLFLDPGSDEYVLRDAYLSGNVRAKLNQAMQAGMMGNVRALEQVMPEDVPAHQISAKLGAPWVPTAVYEDFAKELFGDGTKASIKYQALTSAYALYVSPGSETNNSNKWGIPKYTGTELLAALMNNKTIKVQYKDGEGRVVTDIEATEMAQTKAQEIKDRFSDWLFSDPDRSQQLTRTYNDANNNYVVREYDGSWMTFPGKVPNMQVPGDGGITFRRHQRNAIARIVQDRTALLDHVVGAGKTMTVAAAAMEMKRTGIARKSLIAVPNHLVKQWAAEFYRLYPGANILTATKKDFERVNRRRFLAKIASGDWDAVIIAHSSYGFIEPGAEFEQKFNQKQVEMIQQAIDDTMAEADDEKAAKRTVKQLEGMKERLENRIRRLRDKPMDDLLDFAELGVDQLFVDEAHLFKNLMYQTKLQNVAGLGDPEGAKRAYDMYVKTQQLMEANGRGQGVVFATGTPVSNSLAEKYHMMRYLMPRQMEELGFQSFDAWANTYADVRQHWMQKIGGDGFKAQNRMSEFVNVHELLRLFDQVADTVTNDDIKKAYKEETGEEYPLPPVKTGRRQPVSLEKSPAQVRFMEDLAARAAALEKRKGPPKKGEDNHLSLMTDARKAAADIRMIKPSKLRDLGIEPAGREPGGRVDKAADNLLERYEKYNAVRGTQLVFSDLGTPKKHAAKELKEYQALTGLIAEATDEVRDRAALGDERSQEIVNAAEDAERELDEKGRDWLDSVEMAMAGFSIYDDLKEALIERGIPEHEIAFIHDFEGDERKAALFRKVNNGDIRILIGSTPKMGAGTNVQERLVAEHHLDVPWRPSDVEQREGRIIRQGNRLLQEIPGFEVEILAYVTKDTLDMRMWQVQEVKLKVIHQLRTRQIERTIDNAFEEMEMSASEMQAAATGNMDLLYEIQARNDIKKLEQKRRSFEAQKNDLIGRKKSVLQKLEQLPKDIERERGRAAVGEAYRDAMAKASDGFKVTIDGKEYTDAAAAGRYLLAKTDAKFFTRTAEKNGKKVREEMSGDDMRGLRDQLAALREAGKTDEDAEVQALIEKTLGFEEKAAPLDVEMDGVQYTARAKLAEAFSDIRGDVSPIRWEYGGKSFNRRTAAAAAMRQDVADAVADEKEVAIGSVGGWAVTVEGQPADKMGLRSLDVVMRQGEHQIDGMVSIGEEASKNMLRVAERVIEWADSRASSYGSSLSWLERNLQTAKAQAADLAKAEDLGEWPDQAKLDAARAKHAEVLKRLSGSGDKSKKIMDFGSFSGTPTVMTAEEYAEKFQVPLRDRLAGRFVVTMEESGGGFPGAPADGFATREGAKAYLAQFGVSFAQGKAAFFQQPGAETRKSAAKLQYVADAMRDAWGRAPDIIAVPSVASNAVPLDVRKEAAARLRAGGGMPKAVIAEGRVYLFADAIADEMEAVEMIAHEVLGHYGMRGRFGDALDAELDTVERLRGGDIQRMLDRMGKPDTPENRIRAAEEVVAYMAQTKPELTTVQRVIAAIRNWLREHVPFLRDIELTDADIIQKFILPARRFVEGDGPRGGGQEAPAFGAAAQPFYSALMQEVGNLTPKSLPAAGWQGAINSLLNKGQVKADEIEWSGIREWLEMQQGKVTKDAVLGFLRENGVLVQEVQKSVNDVDDLHEAMIQRQENLHAAGWALDIDMDGSMVGVINRKAGIESASYEWDEDEEEFVNDDGDNPPAEIAEMVRQYALARDAYERARPNINGGNETRYSQYTLPGGENYREVLLTLPANEIESPLVVRSVGSGAWELFNTATQEEEGSFGSEAAARAAADRANTALRGKADSKIGYRSSHWSEPNILAHIRLNDRTDAEGKRVLFVEEIQSDWAQAGRKSGFMPRDPRNPTDDEVRAYFDLKEGANPADFRQEMLDHLSGEGRGPRGWNRAGEKALAPRAPFVEKTDAWLALALKRVIHMAATEGYDRVAFVTGKQSADRYSLSTAIAEAEWHADAYSPMTVVTLTPKARQHSNIVISVRHNDSKMEVVAGPYKGKSLPDIVGKGLAEKIMGQEEGRLRDLELDIGGEGMIAFYDKIIPAAVNKLLAKVGGGKMSEVRIQRVTNELSMQRDGEAPRYGGEALTQPGFDVTPAMREKAADGLPLFNQGSSRTIEVDGVRRPVENSAGQPIVPNHDMEKLRAFWRWFGDSKVVDDQGRPLVVYHGTGDDFTEFDTNKGQLGTHFGTFEQAAKVADYHYWKKRPARTIPAYLALKNMLRLKDTGSFGPAFVRSQLGALGIPVAESGDAKQAIVDAGYDSVVYANEREGGGDSYVAFKSTQIKSATGNRGTYDAGSGNIMFAQGMNSPRDFMGQAREAVREMGATPGKLHWWHKTLGTQYNLAQKSAPFRRVFDRVQDFLQDVSLYATEAADKAPTILPKLEHWKDILKTALPAKDTAAMKAPVFEGTLMWTRDENGKPVKVDELEARFASLSTDDMAHQLMRRNLLSPNVIAMWQGRGYDFYQQAMATAYKNRMLKPGIVWTDIELAERYNLTERQIGLYREFRAATDESLTRLALSSIVRLAGEDGDFVREQVMQAADVTAGAEMMRDQLLALAEQQPERSEGLTKTATMVMDKAERAADLMARGYAPLMRFGHYTVTVMGEDEKGEPETKFFGMYESRFDAARAAKQLEAEFAGEGTVSRGTMNEEAYKLFQGVSPETVELFGEMLGMNETGDSAADLAFQSYLKLARANRDAMKRMIHRKGTAGFSEDAGRVLAGFVYSNARATSRYLHAGEILDAVNAIPKREGELQRQATRLMEYVKNPQEEAQALRGLLFAQYLGGNIASAMVNMTQPFAVTMPWLSQFGGIRAAAGQMKEALRVAWADSTGDAALDAALKRAVEEGIVAPQEVHQLMAQAAGKGSLKSGDGTAAGDASAALSNFGSRLMLAWGKPFSTAELFNRRVTFVAAYRTAVQRGMGNPYEFATRAVNETQFVYNKGNRPEWARGLVGATLMTFKQYSISYLELLERMWTAGEPGSPERAAGRRAVLFAAGMLLLMGGAGGLPFVEDVEDIVDGLMQRLGYNFSSKQKKRELLQEAFGKAFGGFLEKGVSGLPGAPIDVANRLGLGNLIPGTGLFQKKEDHARDVTEILGPAGDLATRVARGANMASEGRVIDAGVEVSPTAARNIGKAIEMAVTGEYRDTKGYKVLDVDGADAAAKAIGFQPRAVSIVQEGDRAAQQMAARARMREDEIARKWAKGFADGKEDLKTEARAELQDWNEKNPEAPIKIKIGDVLKRAHKMRQSRAERIEKAAPKEVRQEARRLMQDR